MKKYCDFHANEAYKYGPTTETRNCIRCKAQNQTRVVVPFLDFNRYQAEEARALEALRQAETVVYMDDFDPKKGA